MTVIKVFGGALTVPPPAAADDNGKGAAGHAHDLSDVWAIARGGQLYDNWMAVIEADKPKATHPAYPKAGKKKGASTWRCKECHGWDYMGKDGAYAKGSHYTGIKGVRAMVGMDVNKIHRIIMDKTHGFTKQRMPHSAMEKLALFLSEGQVDNDRYIAAHRKWRAAMSGAARRSSRPSASSATVSTAGKSTSRIRRKPNTSAPCVKRIRGKACTRSASASPASAWRL
ncbi:MAG: hypothetical protein IH994_05325 [Proteobacteria bacterium]|nr:hypothetical protein [Pseudomonadota bacterium]